MTLNYTRLVVIVSMLVAGSAVHASPPITYQGELRDGGVLANGVYDMTFQLADSAVFGLLLDSVEVDDVPVVDGQFKVEIEFDDSHFDGSNRWIAVIVENSMLSPRQRVTHAPYSIRAELAADLEVPWIVAANTRIIDATSNFDITIRAGTGTGPSAVDARNTGAGSTAVLAGRGFGVEGRALQTPGDGTGLVGYGGAVGVYGFADPASTPMTGEGLVRNGVIGLAPSEVGTRVVDTTGVYGFASCPPSSFLIARRAYGVHGEASRGGDSFSTAYAVFGEVSGPPAGVAYAGYFSGNVHVAGALSKTVGAFKIDHPLSPETKYLTHSFVESPEMLNIYSGVVVLDASGRADVRLPEYFGALNTSFRYQLTPIGAPMRDLHVASEVSDNSFAIGGGVAGGKVSWEVSGVRHDAAARAHPIVVEEEKAAHHRGRYLNPEAFGLDHTWAIHSSRAAKQ